MLSRWKKRRKIRRARAALSGWILDRNVIIIFIGGVRVGEGFRVSKRERLREYRQLIDLELISHEDYSITRSTFGLVKCPAI